MCKKKVWAILLLVFCISVNGFAAKKVARYLQPVFFDYSQSESILQPYISAAFTIYGSAYSVDTDSCTPTMYESTFTVVFSSNGIDDIEATYIFDLNRSTSDTIVELIQQLNLNTYITAALADGCYGAGVSTTTTTGRFDGEGLSEGLAYGLTGDSPGNCLGSSNTVTFYNQGITIMSRYFTPSDSTQSICILEITSTSTAKTNILSLFEGDVSTNTVTPINIDITDMGKVYSRISPIKASAGSAVECRVIHSTWSGTGDWMLIHKLETR